MRFLSGREGRRPGWRQPLRSLLRSLRVPGTAARSSESSRSPGPGGAPESPRPRPSAVPRIFSGSPRLQPAMGSGSHPRSRLAVPGQSWQRVQTLAAGPPTPAEAGRDTSASAEPGKAALGTAFRGRPGGRMWNEGMISLTLPGDPWLLPALLSGAARSSRGHPSARRAGGLSLPLGGKEGRPGTGGGRSPVGT